MITVSYKRKKENTHTHTTHTPAHIQSHTSSSILLKYLNILKKTYIYYVFSEWNEWNPSADCSLAPGQQCGYGLRSRTRTCPVPGACSGDTTSDSVSCLTYCGKYEMSLLSMREIANSTTYYL